MPKLRCVRKLKIVPLLGDYLAELVEGQPSLNQHHSGTLRQVSTAIVSVEASGGTITEPVGPGIYSVTLAFTFRY